MPKSPRNKWDEITHGVWWLPFSNASKEESNNSRKRKVGTLFLCDKCDNVYSIDSWGKKVYFYIDFPRLQPKKTCKVCLGKNYKKVLY